MPMIGAMRAQSYQVPYFESLEVYKHTNLCFPFAKGTFFYLFVESPSSIFMHRLKRAIFVIISVMCIVPKFIIDWLMIMVLLVLKLFVSSHPLNFEGVLAFMFCYSMKDKLNTTLLCFSMLETNLYLSSALLFMIFFLCTFSCCNMVAKLYC